jgi:hypothetical protein
MKNICVNCKEEWNVNLQYAQLDQIDMNNIEKFGCLYSICEDCNEGECESIAI